MFTMKLLEVIILDMILLMIELLEDFALIEYRVDTALGKDAGLGHFFHSEKGTVFFSFHFPNFSETTLTDSVKILEVCLGYLLLLLLLLDLYRIFI